MHVIKYALLFAADVVLIGCVTTFFYMHLFKPVDLVILDIKYARDKHYKKHYRHKALLYAWLVTSLFGIGIFIYSGTAFLLSWMSWDTYAVIAMMSAFFGSLGIIDGLGRMARKVNDLELSNDQLRASFIHIRDQLNRLEASVRSSLDIRLILDELEKKSLELRPRIRDQFKEDELQFPLSPENEIRQYYYRIDVGPSLQLVKVLRRIYGLPDKGL